MNILAFADMHGDYKALSSIEAKSKGADIILNCGDFTIFDKDLVTYLDRFEAFKRLMLITPGNHELECSLKKACSNLKFVQCLIDDHYLFDRTIILAAEGDCFAYDNRKFLNVADEFRNILDRKRGSYDFYILMTHAPPFGCKLDISRDGHCGNRIIRKLIEDTQPDCSFHGHIHTDNCEEDWIGKTVVINPGARGVMIEL